MQKDPGVRLFDQEEHPHRYTVRPRWQVEAGTSILHIEDNGRKEHNKLNPAKDVQENYRANGFGVKQSGIAIGSQGLLLQSSIVPEERSLDGQYV